MKEFRWSEEKNALLKQDRGIGFEEVVTALYEKKILHIANHPNQEKYPGQKILIVEIDGYAFIVPYVVEKHGVFLKTIIPSRKATKKHISDNKQ